MHYEYDFSTFKLIELLSDSPLPLIRFHAHTLPCFFIHTVNIPQCITTKSHILVIIMVQKRESKLQNKEHFTHHIAEWFCWTGIFDSNPTSSFREWNSWLKCKTQVSISPWFISNVSPVTSAIPDAVTIEYVADMICGGIQPIMLKYNALKKEIMSERWSTNFSFQISSQHNSPVSGYSFIL